MSARIFPFISSLLPQMLYLDTSFVWELYDPYADPIRRAECTAFLDRLHKAGVMMVINSFVIQELRHVILMKVYRTESRGRRMSAIQRAHALVRGGSHFSQECHVFYRFSHRFPWELV